MTWVYVCFQSPAVQAAAAGDNRQNLDEIDDVFFNSPNPTSPYVVQMRQHPFARLASPHTPQLLAAAGGDAAALPAIQGASSSQLPSFTRAIYR